MLVSPRLSPPQTCKANYSVSFDLVTVLTRKVCGIYAEKKPELGSGPF